MALNIFIVSLQLEVLKDFLNHITESAHKKLNQIDAMAGEGALYTLEDLESAESPAFAWIEYASRAVYYELAAIVEHELHRLASAPWAESRRRDDDGTGDPAELTMEEIIAKISQTKHEVSKLRFDKIFSLIETHYGTRISEVEGWVEVNRMREVVNDLKHRGGYSHIRTIDWQNEGYPQCRRIEPEQARAAIASVTQFFCALNDCLGVRRVNPREPSA